MRIDDFSFGCPAPDFNRRLPASPLRRLPPENAEKIRYSADDAHFHWSQMFLSCCYCTWIFARGQIALNICLQFGIWHRIWPSLSLKFLRQFLFQIEGKPRKPTHCGRFSRGGKVLQLPNFLTWKQLVFQKMRKIV